MEFGFKVLLYNVKHHEVIITVEVGWLSGSALDCDTEGGRFESF